MRHQLALMGISNQPIREAEVFLSITSMPPLHHRRSPIRRSKIIKLTLKRPAANQQPSVSAEPGAVSGGGGGDGSGAHQPQSEEAQQEVGRKVGNLPYMDS